MRGSKMNLLVGLGNPGLVYSENRHNLGFMVVDEIHRRYDFAPYRLKFDGELSEGELGTAKVLLLKPTTFMNESGKCVGAAARFYKIAPDKLIVLHDEIDLAPGKVRVKIGGGMAGHNGLKSISQHFGQEFWRVRIGIGHPGEKDLVTGHVLRDFAPTDRNWVSKIIDVIADAIPLLILGRDTEFMAKVGLASGLLQKVDTKEKDWASNRQKESPK